MAYGRHLTIRSVFAGIIAAASFSAGAPAGERNCEDEVGLVQIIVEAGTSIRIINDTYGTGTVDSLPPLYLLQIPEGSSVDSLLKYLQIDPEVVAAERAYISQTPEGTRQMMVAGVGGTIEDFQDQEVGARIGLDAAHAHMTGAGVSIGVVDTGVLSTHPALEGNVSSAGYDFVENDADPSEAENGADDDGDGFTDEGFGHGTMVAGIAHLVAPDASLLPLRVLDDEGRGRTFNVAKAIRFAVENGARVINLSLGLTCVSEIIRHEILRADSAGVTIVAAAGNEGVEEPPYYPASDSATLSVTAVDSVDVKASFANYHPTVDLSAPGVGILAPFANGSYALGAGTSFAAPFIAGQAALIRSVDPGLSKVEVDSVARAGSVPIDAIPGNEPYAGKLGSGRVDLWETWLVIPAAAGVEPLATPPRPAVRVFPNPAATTGTVTIQLPFAAERISIHDPSGALVRRLDSPAGRSVRFAWNGRTEEGRAAPAGIYFVSVPSGATGAAAPPRLVRLAR